LKRGLGAVAEGLAVDVDDVDGVDRPFAEAQDDGGRIAVAGDRRAALAAPLAVCGLDLKSR